MSTAPEKVAPGQVPLPSLADVLLRRSPRETSGAPTANRFAFHRTWALCQLLKLHAEDANYVLILEFHDDVLVLDSGTNPTQAQFFQIKTKTSGRWTKRDLLKIDQPNRQAMEVAHANEDKPKKRSRKAPHANSILGKLILHVSDFAPHVKTLNIVSNQRYNLKCASSPESVNRESLCLKALDTQLLEEVQAAVQKELLLAEAPALDNVYLIVWDVSLTAHDTHGIGALTEFLDKRTPNARFAVQPFFRTLCSEVLKRATHEWSPTSLEDLCQRKGISRAEFEELLQQVEKASRDPAEDLTEIKAQLTSEGESYRAVQELAQAWLRYEVARMDRADIMVQSLREQVCAVTESVRTQDTWTTLRQFTNQAVEEYIRRHGEPQLPFDKRYLEAVILLEMKSYEARQPPTSDSQPSKETT